MTDSHLRNAIKWAERNADRVRLVRASALDIAACFVSGEIASYDLQQAADALWEGCESDDEWWDEYRWLLEEAEKRGFGHDAGAYYERT